MVEVLNTAWRTATKDHRCDACMGNISAGEKYHVQTCVDGDLYQYKMHGRCFSAVATVMNGPGWRPGDEAPHVYDLEDEDWEFIREESPDTYAAFMSRTNGDGPDLNKARRETQA